MSWRGIPLFVWSEFCGWNSTRCVSWWQRLSALSPVYMLCQIWAGEALRPCLVWLSLFSTRLKQRAPSLSLFLSLFLSNGFAFPPCSCSGPFVMVGGFANLTLTCLFAHLHLPDVQKQQALLPLLGPPNPQLLPPLDLRFLQFLRLRSLRGGSSGVQWVDFMGYKPHRDGHDWSPGSGRLQAFERLDGRPDLQHRFLHHQGVEALAGCVGHERRVHGRHD